MAVQTSQVAVECLVRVGTTARISQVAAEALIRLYPTVQVSQVAVEILAPLRHGAYSFDVEFDQEID